MIFLVLPGSGNNAYAPFFLNMLEEIGNGVWVLDFILLHNSYLLLDFNHIRLLPGLFGCSGDAVGEGSSGSAPALLHVGILEIFHAK